MYPLKQVTPHANGIRPVKREAAEAAPSCMSITLVGEEDEEQEKSLLELTPPPQKPFAVPTPPIPEVEELKGPKSRLVIHKVLINFKSYVGKHVIGIFHKVRNNGFSLLLYYLPTYFPSNSHSLQSLVPTVLASPTQSTRSSSSSVITPRKWDRENYPNSSITP